MRIGNTRNAQPRITKCQPPLQLHINWVDTIVIIIITIIIITIIIITIIYYIPTNCTNLLFIYKQHIKTFVLFKLLKLLLHVSVTD